MKKLSLKIFLTACFLGLPTFISDVLAQPPPPGPGNGVPVDGVSILAALGILYSAFKLRKRKK